MRKSASGFTIIELLIVIVVIAILTAIAFVSYNGLQERAYNTKVIAGAKQYHKAFLSYKAVYGAYPGSLGCLGKGYPNNACWAAAADGTSAQRSINASLDNSLNEFIPSASKLELATELIYIVIATSYRAGAVYLPGDGTYGFRFTYYLKGNNANCGLAVTAQANEGPLTQCNISLP